MRSRPEPRPLERLLVAAVLVQPGDVVGDLGTLPGSSIREAAHLHRVTPAVHRYLARTPGAPAEWVAELRGPARLQAMRHMLALADLAAMRDVLRGIDCPWAAVKGPVAAELIWPAVSMREYYDVDLLVPRARFAQVLDAFLAAGFAQVDRNWPLLQRSRRAEVAMRGPHGSPIDLHWDIAVPPRLRAAFPTDVAGMLNRARERSVGSALRIPVLDAVDTAVHLAFHAAQGGANRLMWLADVRFAVTSAGFDWDEFARRVRAMRFEVPAALVLARTERTLGFVEPVPGEVLAPARGLWGSMTELRDASVPFPGLPGDEHLGGGLYVSARRRVLASGAALVRHAVGAWRAERHPRTGAPPLYADIPDEQARRRYLAAVSQEVPVSQESG